MAPPCHGGVIECTPEVPPEPKVVKSRGGHKPDRLLPLLWRPACSHDVIRPRKRQIDWWTDQERDPLFWTRPPNQFTKFASLPSEMFAHVEHYQVVQIGMPEKLCRTQVLRDVYLDAVTAKKGSSHVPRGLGTVDQENFLVSKI